MDLLCLAYELAFFLHRRRELALRIAVEALAKLEVVALKQDQRYYYRPQKRRNKVMMTRLQLLQRLVYRESSPHEDSRLRAGSRTSFEITAPEPPPGDDLLTIWLIKHLVASAVKRNAFHVALAVCRVLYRYTTSETTAIYDHISRDPDCRFGEAYCRSRKGVLMRELEQRFADRLEPCSAERGELRFLARESSARLNGMVEECLDKLTPWGTSCPGPGDDGVDEAVEAISQLTGADPDAGHAAELQRMHVLLHPCCLARCTRELGLEPPSTRLAVPVLREPRLVVQASR